MANIKKNMNKKGVFGLKMAIISLIALVLFSYLILGFAYNFISVKNPSSPVLTYGNNSLPNSINSMNNSLEDIRSLSDDVKQDFIDSEPSATDYLFLIFQGAFFIPKAIFYVLISGLQTLITVMTFGSVGSSTAIATSILILSAGIIIVIVLVAIRFIRSGNE